MMILNFVLVSLLSVSGFSPAFQPPSSGIGAENPGASVRAFSMGSVSAGVPDSNMVSASNPAASAWAKTTGLAWGTKVRDTRDLNLSGAADFPLLSVIMPLPLGLQFSGLLSSRSRINAQDPVVFSNGSGTIDWTGSSGESYAGVTARVSQNLAFSLGGKCFFGSALGNATTSINGSGSSMPITTDYRDDLAFSPSWGPVFGAFMNTGVLSAGFSITTDRSGDLSINRDYSGSATADTTLRYSVPGELSAGISTHIHPRILVGVDFFARKALNLLDHTTEEGSYLASGIEISPGFGFRVRGGFRTMDGLWRDGASTYSGGLGYNIAGGKASVDAGISYETWNGDESETVFFASIRASENWLGQ
jgi:hypothetical protein